ncbi:MAG: Two-component hybrid sensor and regulator [Parcubacteria group bacterium GW2011_GWB1_40_14]|nr:MAG: Two-component hybrid sensor and regulator [Parcubacteria group bacterium GW2011_GWB1_40_14]
MKQTNEKKLGFLSYLRSELDVVGQCRKIRVPLWQCPRLLFIGMGMVIILAIVFTYFFVVIRTEPEIAALIVMMVAGFLMVQSYLILFATENLAETNRLKNEFINITSHQLRSPLTASKWALELVLESAKDLPPEAQENFRIIEDSNARMGKLVYLLLQVARIEANTLKQHKRDVSFAETVQATVDQNNFFVKASNIELEFIPSKEDFEVNFDPEQLRFIIQEILDNAIRYSGGGKIKISYVRANSNILFEIKDSGVGIPKDEQKNIFQKFYRGSNIYTLSPGGTGLSLFIIKKMLEANGGKIGFKSTTGEGSIFWFTIPLINNSSKKIIQNKNQV